MDQETQLWLAALGGTALPAIAGLAVLLVRRRRRGLRGRLYLSLRSEERESTASPHSQEPPPFPRSEDHE